MNEENDRALTIVDGFNIINIAVCSGCINKSPVCTISIKDKFESGGTL